MPGYHTATEDESWKDTVSEWLRRQIRIVRSYLFHFVGAGSNPAGVDFFFVETTAIVLVAIVLV